LRKVAGTVLILSISIAIAMFAPAFAKNMNLPEGATAVVYYSLGTAQIAIPADWPIGGKHFEEIEISAVHIEGGSLGTCDSVVINVPVSSAGSTVWVPVALFSTGNTYLQYIKIVLSGFPAALSPINSKLLSEDVLIVERHGNRMNVELKSPQTVYWTKATPPPPVVSIAIPAFKFELDQVGGSFHEDTTHSFTGYASSSNYTRQDDEMGFYGNGVLTCSAWSYLDHPMTDGRIVMHGIRTYFPPLPP